MSMKVTGNSLFNLPITGEVEKQPKKISDVIKNDKPITVDISKEAMERYRRTIQEQNKGKPTVDEMMQNREMLSKLVQPEEEIGYQFKLKYKEFSGSEKEFRSSEEVGNNLLKAYAGMYDEIIKGYESGERERYVSDFSKENGLQYRKLTLEDELAELDKTFQHETELAESWLNGRKESVQAYNNFLKSIESQKELWRKPRKFEQSEKTKKLNEQIMKDMIPAQFSGKLWDASRTFIQQYSNPAMSAKGIDTLLKGINIF